MPPASATSIQGFLQQNTAKQWTWPVFGDTFCVLAPQPKAWSNPGTGLAGWLRGEDEEGGEMQNSQITGYLIPLYDAPGKRHHHAQRVVPSQNQSEIYNGGVV